MTSERWNSNNYSSNEESDRCQSIAGSGHGIVRESQKSKKQRESRVAKPDIFPNQSDDVRINWRNNRNNIIM